MRNDRIWNAGSRGADTCSLIFLVDGDSPLSRPLSSVFSTGGMSLLLGRRGPGHHGDGYGFDLIKSQDVLSSGLARTT